jgi:hypothetical protein
MIDSCGSSMLSFIACALFAALLLGASWNVGCGGSPTAPSADGATIADAA